MSDITPKQTKAITALLTCRTVTEAATVANISTRQLYRWLELPAFVAALKAAESQVIDEATRRLLAGMGDALDTLHDLMTTGTSESVRRAAADNWLAQVLRVRELADIEKRLVALEKTYPK
jgi:hypothetical protein